MGGVRVLLWFLAAATGDAIGAQLPRLDAVIGQSRNFLWQGAMVIAAGAVMVFFTKRLKVLTGEAAAARQTVAVAA